MGSGDIAVRDGQVGCSALGHGVEIHGKVALLAWAEDPLHGHVAAVGGKEAAAGGRYRPREREPARDGIRAGLVHPPVDLDVASWGEADRVSGADFRVQGFRLRSGGVKQGFEIDTDRPDRLASRHPVGVGPVRRRHELDLTPGILAWTAGRPDEIRERSPRPGQRIEARLLYAAHDGDDPAPILGDQHVHLRRLEDARSHEPACDVLFEGRGGEPLGSNQAEERDVHLATGAHASAQLVDG